MDQETVEAMIRSAERQTGVRLTPAARSLLLNTVEGNQGRLSADLRTGRMTVPKMRGAIIRLLNKVEQQQNVKTTAREPVVPRRLSRKMVTGRGGTVPRKITLPRYELAIFYKPSTSVKSVASVQLFCQFYPFCDPSKSKRGQRRVQS